MKIINTNIFYLPNTNNRFIHLATIQDNLREYIYFKDSSPRLFHSPPSYIEELTGGHLTRIKSDDKVREVEQLLLDNNVHDCQRVSIVDALWRVNPKKIKYYKQ